MPAGYMIRVISPPIRNEGSTLELFEVAIEDENQAKSTARKASQAAADAIVEIAAELSAAQIAQLELQTGQVRRAP
jgi:uncharacterized protein YggE